MNKIDFVVTWLDSTDENWQRQYAYYKERSTGRTECDNNAESLQNVPIYCKEDGYGIYMSILASIGVINAHFDRRQVVRQSQRRWYGRHLGRRGLLLSLMLRHHKRFPGSRWRHFEQPLLKSVLEEASEKASEVLLATCTKFREEVQIVPPYFFRYWQFASNRFYPVRLYRSIHYNLHLSKLDGVERALHNSKVISLCLNDTAKCPDEEYEIINRELQKLLEQ